MAVMTKERIAIVAATLMLTTGVLQADSLDHWTRRNSDVQTNTLKAVEFGNGLFVAVGDTILTSPDGSFWMPAKEATTNLTGVAWGSNRYVAVGLRKTILISSDGSHWTKQYSGDPDWDVMDFLGVGFGNGLFIAVGSTPTGRSGLAGLMRTSSSSESGWVSPPVPPDVTSRRYLDSVAYGNGVFRVVGNNLEGMSSNGIDWTWQLGAVPILPILPDKHVAYGEGHFVVVSSFGDILFDDNLIQQGSLPGTNLTEQFYGVTYGNGYFVAVGAANNQAGLPPASLIKVSSDGTNWTSINLDSVNPLYGVAYGQNTFVAVGAGIILQSDYLVTEPTFLAGQTARSVDGSITLAIQSPAGKTINVESSDDLARWRSLVTVTNLEGVITVIDTNVQSQPQRFYRAKLAAP